MGEHMPYGGVPPFEAGSDTSLDAARRKNPASDQAKVLAFIQARGDLGATDDEVEATLGLRHQNASPRRRTLELDGLVVKTAATRPTRSGRAAHVYVAVYPPGRAGGSFTPAPAPPAPEEPSEMVQAAFA